MYINFKEYTNPKFYDKIEISRKICSLAHVFILKLKNSFSVSKNI